MTFATFHAASGWLNADALRKVNANVVALETSQLEISSLKDAQAGLQHGRKSAVHIM